jgi:3-oxoacyl-[acyl-carrier-protein] synthase-3
VATTIESVGTAAGGRWRRRSATALADEAARRALAGAGLVAADVELLVNAGLYHDGILGEPALAALIQSDIGAHPEDPHPGGHGTFSFDVANGSCGMLTGIQVADGFLRAGTIRHALVVASDADPGHGLSPGFPFGRTGAAVVCGWAPGDRGIVAMRFADPPDDRAGRYPGGGLHATVRFARGRNTLTVDERPRFAPMAAIRAGAVAEELLADLDLTAEDVDLVVANPQAPDFLDTLAGRLRVPRERVLDATDGPAAHTAGLGIALDAALEAGRFPARSTLLVSAGAGPVAGAALVRG